MIYFMRHGESEANIRHVFAGQKDDSPLTAIGQHQAAVAAERLRGKSIKKIITTSLIRANHTAQIMAEGLGNIPVEIDDRLLEYDMGVLTGTPNRVITSEDLVSAEGAENPEDFRKRVIDALIDAFDANNTALIVSHAGVARIIEAERQGISPYRFYDLPPCPNAQPFLLDEALFKPHNTFIGTA